LRSRQTERTVPRLVHNWISDTFAKIAQVVQQLHNLCPEPSGKQRCPVRDLANATMCPRQAHATQALPPS
jgi:hypothetical protein